MGRTSASSGLYLTRPAHAPPLHLSSEERIRKEVGVSPKRERERKATRTKSNPARSTRPAEARSNGGPRRPLRLPGPPLPLHLLAGVIMLLPLPPRRRLRAAPPARLPSRHAPLRRGQLLLRSSPRSFICRAHFPTNGLADVVVWVWLGVVCRWRGPRRSGGAALAAAEEGPAHWRRPRARTRGSPTSRSRR